MAIINDLFDTQAQKDSEAATTAKSTWVSPQEVDSNLNVVAPSNPSLGVTPDKLYQPSAITTLGTSLAGSINQTSKTIFQEGYKALNNDPTYNAFHDPGVLNKGKDYLEQYGHNFVDSPNGLYSQYIMDQIDKQQKDALIDAANPTTAFVGQSLGALVDPSIAALGAFPLMKGANFLEKAFNNSVIGAGFGAVQTINQSQISLDQPTMGSQLASVVTGAMLGAAFTGIGEGLGAFAKTEIGGKIISAAKEQGGFVDASGLTEPDISQHMPAVDASIDKVGTVSDLYKTVGDTLSHDEEGAASTSKAFDLLQYGLSKLIPKETLMRSKSGFSNYLGQTLAGYSGLLEKNLGALDEDGFLSALQSYPEDKIAQITKDNGAVNPEDLVQQARDYVNGKEGNYSADLINIADKSTINKSSEADLQHTVFLNENNSVQMHLKMPLENEYMNYKKESPTNTLSQRDFQLAAREWASKVPSKEDINTVPKGIQKAGGVIRSYLDRYAQIIQKEDLLNHYPEIRQSLADTFGEYNKLNPAEKTSGISDSLENELYRSGNSDVVDNLRRKIPSQHQKFLNDILTNAKYAGENGAEINAVLRKAKGIKEDLESKNIEVTAGYLKRAEKNEPTKLDPNYINHEIDPNLVQDKLEDFKKMVAEKVSANKDLDPAEIKAKVAEITQKVLAFDKDSFNMSDGINFRSKNLKLRTIKFDNAEIMPYLNKDVLGSMYRYTHSIELERGYRKFFGQDWRTSIPDKIDTEYKGLINAEPTTKGQLKLDKERGAVKKIADNLIQMHNGTYEKDNGKIGRVLNLVKGYQGIRLLGQVAFKHAPLLARNLMSRYMFQHGQDMSGFMSHFGDTVVKMSKNERAMLGSTLDHISNTWNSGNTYDVYNSFTDASDISGRIINKVQGALNIGNKLQSLTNGLDILNAVGRTWIGNNVMDNMAKGMYALRDGKLKVDSFQAREMARFGIDSKNVGKYISELEQHATTDKGTYGKTTNYNLDKWNPEIGLDFAAKVRRTIDHVLTNPTTGDQPQFTRGPVGGILSQFMALPISIVSKGLAGNIQEVGLGGQYMHRMIGRVVAGTTVGMMMSVVQDAVRGNPLNLDPAHLLSQGLERGGTLPLLDNVMNQMEHLGMSPVLDGTAHHMLSQGGPLDSLLGPTYAFMNQDVPKAFKAAIKGEMDDKAVKKYLKVAPFGNNFLIAAIAKRTQNNL